MRFKGSTVQRSKSDPDVGAIHTAPVRGRPSVAPTRLTLCLLLLAFSILNIPFSSFADQIPLQFARPFKCGDAQSPVLRDVPTQVTVKTRCAKGVTLAIFNAVIEGKNGDVPKIDFVEGKPVTGSAAIPALDVTLEIKTPIDGKTYLYKMQSLPKLVWFDGPIASSVRYADYKSTDQFKPIFEITHWHTLGKTFVRVIGENSNSEKI
ncbi:MAG TPA: hypothetical protein VNT76_13190, partial [Candidatus Binatus sp.]|nr:hypothetical protein [Candidatus Binatus sp.]